MTTLVATILQNKARELSTALAGDSVAAAVTLLAERRIGALPVLDAGGRLIGILSERDVVRALAADPAVLTRRVEELMTSEVKTCSLHDSVLELMGIMTRGRFRHVPVLHDGKLVGIMSIGDVVKHRLEEAQFELEALKSYIAS
jgi:CBS domain-containing protein